MNITNTITLATKHQIKHIIDSNGGDIDFLIKNGNNYVRGKLFEYISCLKYNNLSWDFISSKEGIVSSDPFIFNPP